MVFIVAYVDYQVFDVEKEQSVQAKSVRVGSHHHSSDIILLSP